MKTLTFDLSKVKIENGVVTVQIDEESKPSASELTSKRAKLEAAWVERNKLHAEGDKLHAEGDKLYAEGDKLYAEGNKLYAEGDKLRAEGNKLCAEGDKLCAEGNKLYAEGNLLWANAILKELGNVKVEWQGTVCVVYPEGVKEGWEFKS